MRHGDIIVAERVADNLIMTNGLSFLAEAIMQGFSGNQIASWGNPFGVAIATTTGALSAGTSYTSIPVTGLSGTIPANAPVVVLGGTGVMQGATTTGLGATAAGASSIPVYSSFKPIQTFPSGSAVVYFPGNLGDVWGAVGTGNTAPASGDTQLAAEVGRVVSTAGGLTSNQVSIDFFLGSTVGNATLQEVGAFVNAGQVLATLTSGLALNGIYNSLAVAALSDPIPNGATLILGYGTTQTQVLTVNAQASAGATAISVNSFTANANYGAGVQAAYNFGSLLDHAVLGAPITKSAPMTATLELDLTVTSG